MWHAEPWRDCLLGQRRVGLGVRLTVVFAVTPENCADELMLDASPQKLWLESAQAVTY